jgi:hypothetical protein
MRRPDTPKWDGPRRTTNPENDHSETSWILVKLPVFASGLSAIVYFSTSEGFRQHLIMLIGAFKKLARLLN